MSSLQTSVTATERHVFGTPDARSSLGEHGTSVGRDLRRVLCPAGLVWGALAAARSAARLPVRSLALGLLAATLAVALALVIAATMSSAIGHAAPGKLQPVNQVLDRSAGVAGYGSSVSGAPSRAAARQTKDAVNQATVQVRKLTRLAACVSAAGANTGRIQACETRYMP